MFASSAPSVLDIKIADSRENIRLAAAAFTFSEGVARFETLCEIDRLCFRPTVVGIILAVVAINHILVYD
jgi:hypothetical protein